MKLNDKELIKQMQTDSKVASEGTEFERLDYLEQLASDAWAAASTSRQEAELAQQIITRIKQFVATSRIVALQEKVESQ
jgi:hypothetical protein